VAALQILSEFVEFVEAYVAAGARGNYNAILHRYTCVTILCYAMLLRCYAMSIFVYRQYRAI